MSKKINKSAVVRYFNKVDGEGYALSVASTYALNLSPLHPHLGESGYLLHANTHVCTEATYSVFVLIMYFM